MLEAEPEPGLAASGTNSGILHTGFDSVPGELETRLILRSGELRDAVLDELGVPVLRCGAVMAADRRHGRRRSRAAAARNGVEARVDPDGRLEVPGEAVTDPVAYTLGPAPAAAEVRTDARVEAIERRDGLLDLGLADGGRVTCRRGRELRGAARRRGGAPGRRRQLRDLPAQGRVLRVRPAGRASPSTGSCCRSRPSERRECWCSPRSTARSWPARRRTTARTSPTGRCAPRRTRRCLSKARRDAARARGRGARGLLRRPAARRAGHELRDRPVARPVRAW